MSAHVNKLMSPIVDALADRCDGSIDSSLFRINLEEKPYGEIEKSQYHLISKFHPNPYIYFSLYKKDEVYYLIESGLPELKPNEEKRLDYSGIDNMDHIALYLLFLADSGARPKSGVLAAEIINEVFTEEAQNNGIDPIALERFFPEVNMYKALSLSSLSVGDQADYRLKQAVLSYISSVYELIDGAPIRFSRGALSLYDRLSLDPNQRIPIDNLIQSLLAYRWNFVFLDLYRCIERLYVIGWVKAFSSLFMSPKTSEDLHDTLIDNRFAHHEDEIIDFLFTQLDPALLSELDSVRGGKRESRYIYDLRNKIVHYQQIDVVLDDSTWDVIVVFLLKAIEKFYQIFDIEIQHIGDRGYEKFRLTS